MVYIPLYIQNKNNKPTKVGGDLGIFYTIVLLFCMLMPDYIIKYLIKQYFKAKVCATVGKLKSKFYSSLP